MKLIEVNHLSFSYDGKQDVINDISFSVDSGSYITLIGHNGSGKSTIAKLLIGLLSPKDKDSLLAFGLKYNADNISKIRSRIGVVFQNPDNQFIATTVKDDIAFGLENRCVPSEKMDEIIYDFASKVNMLEYLDKEPEKLSGGQKQRVAIAGVLAMSPDIIIFDEATSMLDPKGKREIKETIEYLRKENKNLTIISITHDIEEAFLSDRVIILRQGKMCFDETPAQLIKHKEELLSLGLDIPFKEKLNDALKNNGLDDVIKELNDD